MLAVLVACLGLEEEEVAQNQVVVVVEEWIE